MPKGLHPIAGVLALLIIVTFWVATVVTEAFAASAALFLTGKARAGIIDGTFQAVQAFELAAGAVNRALLGLNRRDGVRMTGRPLAVNA